MIAARASRPHALRGFLRQAADPVDKFLHIPVESLVEQRRRRDLHADDLGPHALVLGEENLGPSHVEVAAAPKRKVEDEAGHVLRSLDQPRSNDGNPVVMNDGVHPPKSVSGSVTLSAGDQELVLEYFQGPRYHIALQVWVTPPGGSEQIFSVR